MGLIYCPDCAREISEHSLYCVHCGCPASYYDYTKVARPQVAKQSVTKNAAVLNKKADVSIETRKMIPRSSTRSGVLVPVMMTINEASQVTGIVAYALRRMIAENKIVYVKCGSKSLINMDSLVCYLDGADYQLDYIRDYYKAIHEQYNPDNL